MRTVRTRKLILVIPRLILLALLCSRAPAIPAQSATNSNPAPQPIHLPDKFTNLRVLPPNISRAHLVSLMNGYSRQLGVHCSYCHVLNREKDGANFASDLKPEKQAARVMIGMTQVINSRYLGRIPESLKTQATVTCNTCHRGHAVPESGRKISAQP